MWLSTPCSTKRKRFAGVPCLQDASNNRSTLVWVIFVYCEGIAHQNIGPPGHTVNQHYYRQLFLVVWGTDRWKRPAWLRNYDRLVHRNNVPAHSTSSEQQFLAAINMTVVLLPSLLVALGYLRLFLSENEIAANSASCPAWSRNSGTVADHPTRDYYSQFYRYFQQWQKSRTLCINSENNNDQQQREVRVRYVTLPPQSIRIRSCMIYLAFSY